MDGFAVVVLLASGALAAARFHRESRQQQWRQARVDEELAEFERASAIRRRTARSLRCPRCGPLVELGPTSESIDASTCPGCRGHFLPELTARSVVFEATGTALRSVERDLRSTGRSRMDCPACHLKRMAPCRILRTEVHICVACGGVWLDRGALFSVSGGRHEEPGRAAE